MYTSVIGKKFLEYYNKKNNLSLTAEELFRNVIFEIFYNHSKYLQSPANTPLFQLITQKKQHDPAARVKAYEGIKYKIDNYSQSKIKLPDMSYALGYGSADIDGTTSGQITSMELPLEGEDMYASWIGAAFSIGISGGLNFLIDKQEILELLFEGFPVYREYVEQNTCIDNKIETWNGIWLKHRLNKYYIASQPKANFQPVKTAKDGSAKMERPTWADLMFALSICFPKDIVDAYIFSFGQTNKTVGFVRLHLAEAKSILDIYNFLYGKKEGLHGFELAEMYQTEYGIAQIIERIGFIGLKALEPKDFKKYMPGRYNSTDTLKLKDDDKSKTNYSIYITWVVAMLNNKSLLELAEKIANSFKEYEKKGRTGKVTRFNEIKTLLSLRERKEIIDKLSIMAESEPDMSKDFNEVVNALMIDISTDNIPLFITLIKFKYAIVNQTKE